ncbi:MAG: serine/threonine protein kinase, partial [Alphaproteobacteria bacterium]
MSGREALQTGTRLGDCEILSVLGEGGFGITYLAWDADLRSNVALKEYFPSEFAYRQDSTAAVVSRSLAAEADYEKGLEEFQREARLLARFKHANIVRVRKFHRANNTAYMVMDHEQGRDFGSWLAALKRPPRQEELDPIASGV